MKTNGKQLKHGKKQGFKERFLNFFKQLSKIDIILTVFMLIQLTLIVLFFALGIFKVYSNNTVTAFIISILMCLCGFAIMILAVFSFIDEIRSRNKEFIFDFQRIEIFSFGAFTLIIAVYIFNSI